MGESGRGAASAVSPGAWHHLRMSNVGCRMSRGTEAPRHSSLLMEASMTWLFKEEPTHYSYDALEKDGRTTWSCVKNPLAQKHLRAVRKGDAVLFDRRGRA